MSLRNVLKKTRARATSARARSSSTTAGTGAGTPHALSTSNISTATATPYNNDALLSPTSPVSSSSNISTLNASNISSASNTSNAPPPPSTSSSPFRFLRPNNKLTRKPKTSPATSTHRRHSFSHHLHLHRSAATSANLPSTLVPNAAETNWHLRARALALHTPPLPPLLAPAAAATSTSASDDAAAATEEELQSAISSHERGDLTLAAQQFQALADARGVALAMVLYGLCLRHGWGVPVDHERAFAYLQRAARASLDDENGEGETVLALFEIGNCYRYGWGVAKDFVAAREYYLTAAELGDGDAMNEVAWCFLEGVGGGKDKVRAAGFYRRAEGAGCAIVGNTWIHKDKYMKESKG